MAHIQTLREERMEKLSFAHLKRARLPRRTWKFALKDIEYEGLSDFCDGIYLDLVEGNGLQIRGPAGVGKTTMACVMSKYAMLHGATVLYLNGADFVKAGMKDDIFDFETEETVIERAESVNLLIFDNPGMIGKSDHAWSRLQALLKRRGDEVLSTFLICDEPQDHLYSIKDDPTIYVSCASKLPVATKTWSDK